MEIKACALSEKGNVKEVNQDAILVKIANTTSYGRVALAVLCDGMGGLSCGEEASSSMVHRMEIWFQKELERILRGDDRTLSLDPAMQAPFDVMAEVQRSWHDLVIDMNMQIMNYGEQKNIRLGTTIVSLLIIGSQFLLMNVGDSRIYRNGLTGIIQLTHDQSVVQQQLDRGQITSKEAKTSSQRSVLLQCIGASPTVMPEFVRGKVKNKDAFLLCCDGFWRHCENAELARLARNSLQMTEEELKGSIEQQIRQLMGRGEEDNISAVLLSCF